MQISFAQTKTVTGTVTDDTGIPLPGVNVIVKGTTQGTQTDFDGKFSISASEGGVIVFSYVGFANKSVNVGSSNTINISLEAGETLDEVVVTALGVEATPRSVSYAVEAVTSDDIANTGETNLVNALSSKAAGVSVVSASGSVGASSNIRIRGNTSINRSNSPLFIVDGVPIDNSTTGNDVGSTDNSNRAIDINQNDIASINILKGTAAQTLYGLRAANGVIIITTKKGLTGAPQVSVTSTIQFSEVNQLPELQREYAQGRPSGGVPIYRGPDTGEGFSWGPRISSLEYDGDTSYPFNSQGRIVPAGQGNGTPANSYDHYDFFKTGILQDHNVSVRGGSEKIKYYLSGAKLHQTGVAPKEEFDRRSFRADITADLSDNFEVSASGNYVTSGGRRVQRGSNVSGIMLGLLRSTPSFDNSNGVNNPANDPSAYQLADGSQRSYRGGIYDNPYWTVAKNPSFDAVKRFIGRLSFEYKPFDWATIKGTYGYDQYSDVRKSGIDINSAGNPQGQLSDDNIFNEDINTQLLALFDKNITENITFNGLIGYDSYKTESLSRSALGNGLTIPGFFQISNAATQNAFEDISRKELDAFLSEVKFAISDTYFVNAAFRNDWSSTLPADNNSFQSYSVGAAMVFTELFNSNSILNFGKIRGSFGKTGNDAPLFSTLTYYGSAAAGGDGFIDANQFPIFSTVAFERSAQQGNPDIRPETTREFEIGTELKFLDSRIKLDVTYYNKETTDQIIAVDQPAVTGFTSRVVNAGVISNKGWEALLSITPVQTENFSWNIDANFSTYENTVEELAENVTSITLAGFTSTSSRAIAGESYGALFGSRFARNDDGQVLIGDNGFPLVDPEDGVIGDPIPDFTMGIRNSFSYKNFSISALLDIREGGDVWCGTCGIIDYFGTSQTTANQRNITDFVFEGVNVNSGQVNTTQVALADPANGINSYRWVRYGFGGVSEDYIFDSSWVRLREVSLAYNLNSVLKNTFLSGGSVTLAARNLFVITDYPGIDPETNLTGASNGIGLDYFNQPNTKSYALTVKLNF
ncbi:SusC/RagA family TonB-linked outer membrane protein [Leeuwenhoekiella sp. NPDC079379]|uniref:SusC/RagA family TonB-linked outer membrane protein n=1 Tax=Leeuwenhoekiella sp. NPDC079379 TaxID=3364122 RepID=UPI0037CBB413